MIIVITKEIIAAIETAKCKLKKIEARRVPEEFRAESAWLEAINDVIDRTALSIRDELETV